MATVTERLEQVIEREAPAWGIRPVPMSRRRLSALDTAVLWGDLSIGLLVLLTGALLVPALGLRQALLAIVVGSLVGCVPLALVGLAGAREGVPGMVLFRPVLGVRGSYLPTVLNVVQLVGWTAFEFWAMTQVADRMSLRLFGFSNQTVWLVVTATVCTLLALGGPILVVRRWLEKFAAWVIAGVAVWITIRVVTTAHLGVLWSRPGQGGLPFWAGVDLVVAQPVSWLPLIADYNRFARGPRSSAASSYGGYVFGNVWFYALGALLALSAGLSDATPTGLAQSMASLAGGWVVLLALLAGETHNGFADVYSTAVSAQNLRDRLHQRGAIVAVAVVGALLATWLGARPGEGVFAFENFLFLLGSVFVPLFGVFVADYFLLARRGHGEEALFGPAGARLRWAAIAAWVVGFLVYQWCVPVGPAGWQQAMGTLLHAWLHLPYPLANGSLGASIPSFAAAMLVHLGVAAVRRPRGAARASRRAR